MRLSKMMILTALILGFAVGIISHAQDATEELPPNPPTDIILPSATPTSTDTATVPPSETPQESVLSTLTPTDPPSVPSPSLTSTMTATIPEITPTVELPTSTATLEESTPSETPLPLEPALALLLSENFDMGDLSNWTIDASWTLIPAETGLALQVTDSSTAASLSSQLLYNHTAQIRFRLTSGTLVWNFRNSAVGQYTITLDTNGQLQLLRSGQLIASQYAGIVFPDQWRTVRVSAIADVIRIAVDGVELITFVDSAPLPPGTLAFSTVFPPPADGVEQPQQTLQLDDLIVWVPAAEWTPSPTFTPTISLTPSTTPEFTEISTAETTPEATAEVTEVPTEETTAEFTDVPTEETTPEVTDEPLPDEPPLALLYSDNFDAGATLLWTLGTSWTFTPNDTGQALQATASDAPTTFLYDDLYNVVAEVSFQFSGGAAQLHARRSEVGDYTAALTSTGEVTLYRGQTPLATASVPTDAAWRVVRLSVIEDVLRVSVDGMPVIALRDSAPLPPGLVGFSGHELSESGLRVDDFSLWLPASDLAVTPEVTPTITPTPTLEMLPPEPELTLILEDSFNSGDLSNWTMDAGWALVPSEPLPTLLPVETAEATLFPEVPLDALAEVTLSPEILPLEPVVEATLDLATAEVTAVPVIGQMLQVVNVATPLTLIHDPLRNVVVQADVLLTSSAAQLSLRQSETGAYDVRLYAHGQVELYRSDVLVRAATVSSYAGQWQTVRIAAIENGVRVSINGIDVITFLDAEPLLAGNITFASLAAETASGEVVSSRMSLDNFKLWIPTAELLAPTPVPEPPLQILFNDSFDDGAWRPWMVGTNWRNEYSFTGMDVETWTSEEPARVIDNALEDVAVELTFYLDAGAVRLSVRESELGAYSVVLNPLGDVSLYRGEQLLQTVPITPTEAWQWRRLRISAIDNTIRVSVDGVEAIVEMDADPLPAGTVSFEGVFDETQLGSILRVDDVTVSVRAAAFFMTSVDLPSFAEHPELHSLPEPTPPPLSKAHFLQVFSEPIPYPLTADWVAYSNWEGDVNEESHREEIRITNLNSELDPAVGIKVLGRRGSRETHPAISPDGTRIAFASNCDGDGNYEIFVVDLEDTITRINEGDPTFDPHESFECSIEDQLTHTASPISNRHPTWSPDGTRIAFQTTREGGWKIWVMDALDGGNPQPLLAENIPTLSYIQPAWSPDGSRIAFTVLGCAHQEDIYSANAYGPASGAWCNEMQPVVQGDGTDRHLAWSPDGRLITWTSHRDGNPDVYVSSTTFGVRVNGWFEVNLTTGGLWDNPSLINYLPAWSPDMSQIAFISNYAQILGGAAIHVISINNRTISDNDITFDAEPNPLPKANAAVLNEAPSWAQPSRVCQGIVTITIPGVTTVNVRDEPEGTEILASLHNGDAVNIVGQRVGWYYVNYNADPQNLGWVDNRAIVYDALSCGQIEELDTEGEPAVAPYDYDLAEPDDSWASATCYIDISVVEPPIEAEQNWRNCARVVYHAYYDIFVTANGRPPKMSDILSAVFAGELVDAYSSGLATRVPGVAVTTLAQQALKNNYWTVVYTVYPICRTEPTPFDCDLTLDQVIDSYLVQMQSWYSKANGNSPDTTTIERYLVHAPYQGFGLYTLSTPGVGCDDVQACTWGNYGYGDPDYDNVQNVQTAPMVLYCHIRRNFEEIDGDDTTAIRDGVNPEDRWYDYVFIIGSDGYGTPSTYDYALGTPTWVNAPIIVNGVVTDDYERRHLPDEPEACATPQ